MAGLPVTYVLPLAATSPAPEDLARYVHWLGGQVEVVVVDGSPPPVRAANHIRWGGSAVRHVPVDPVWRYANGKVNGVLTGLALAGHEFVVIADDDVRYDLAGLWAVCGGLRAYDLVVPQNFYAPLPGPARYDTARVLVQRALGRDFPGTLAVRRSTLRAAGGYDGDVLFENLELIRTVRAAGGRVRWARDTFVARRPPTWRHFAGQRVRQAYDEFARPAHLLAALAVLPLVTVSAVRRRGASLAALGGAVVAAAGYGRWREGGAAIFPRSAVALAPVWVLERGCCAWLALLARGHGGVRYRGGRLHRAASSERAIRRRLSDQRAAATIMNRARSPEGPLCFP